MLSERHYAARAHTHTHTHTHNAPRSVHSSLPALGFGAPGTILSFALVGGGRVTVPHARERGGKGKLRGSGGQWAQGRSRVGGQALGSAGRQALGTEQVSPEGGFTLAAAEEGGERGGTRRSAPRLWGWIPPLSRPLALLRRRLPHPGPAADSEPPGPRTRSLPLPTPSSSLSSSPSHVRAGSGFCPDFL